MPTANGLNFKAQELVDAVGIIGAVIANIDNNAALIPDVLTAVNTVAENQGAEALIFEAIQAALGTLVGDATTTVLGRLSAIESLLKCICGDFPPPTEGTDACASPSTTLGAAMRAFDDIPGRAFPVWGEPPPEGLDIYGNGELADATAGVVCNDSGGTYSYYVQSAAPNHRRNQSELVNYPNNVWTPIAGDTILQVSVLEQFNAVGHLCYTPASAFDECVDIVSASNHYHNFLGDVQLDSYAPVWDNLPTAVVGNTLTFGTDAYAWNSGSPVLLMDVFGWTFYKTSATGDIRLLAHHSDNTYTVLSIDVDGTTISEHTDAIWLDLSSNAQFSFQVCPGA